MKYERVTAKFIENVEKEEKAYCELYLDSSKETTRKYGCKKVKLNNVQACYHFYPAPKISDSDESEYLDCEEKFDYEKTGADTIVSQIKAYNKAVCLINEEPEFAKFFKENSYCVSKEQIENKWSKEFADTIFAIDKVFFDTEIMIVNDCLIDTNAVGIFEVDTITANITMSVDQDDSFFRGYGKDISVVTFVDYYGDGRDIQAEVLFFLCEIGVISDESGSSKDDLIIFEDSKTYDQYKHITKTMSSETVLKCLEELCCSGYAHYYKVGFDRYPEWYLSNYKKSQLILESVNEFWPEQCEMKERPECDEYMDFLVVDKAFADDEKVILRIKEIFS